MNVFLHQSPVQMVELRRDARHGLQLLLDDCIQFAEDDEHRYHEGLVVVPMLFVEARRVFIAGGGDGLAATRLLRYDSVTEVVVCDYDEVVTDLATHHADLVHLNGGSMADPRVTVVNDDAYAWLERAEGHFDLVICDLPDPWFPELDRVYSVEFYALIRQRLAPGGVVVVQVRPRPAIASTVRATLGAVFEHSDFYLAADHAGFALASDRPLVRFGAVPPWTRYLTEERVSGAFALGKDDQVRFSPARAEPNREADPHLFQDAVTESYGPEFAFPYPYREGFLWVRLMESVRRTEAQVQGIIQGLHAMAPLVLLVDPGSQARWGTLLDDLGYAPPSRTYTLLRYYFTPHALARIGALWDEWDDGSVASIEVKTVAPADDPDVAGLLERYLADHGERFYDVPHSRYDLEQVDWYALTRDADGQPVALYKGLVSGTTVELELTYVTGTHRQAVLSGALLFGRLHELGVTRVDSFSSTAAATRFLEQIGALSAGELRVRTHHSAAVPPSEGPLGSLLEAAARSLS